MIDISIRIDDQLNLWPDSSGWALHQEQWPEGDDLITNSVLTTDVHVGTHVEAPLHFLKSGRPIDEVDLSSFVGPAYVTHIPDTEVISSSVLEAANIPADVKRLLIRTDNSDWWTRSSAFRPDYVALEESGSEWCADRGLTLVGIDYLSVQSQTAGAETHRALLRAGVSILEGLRLTDVEHGQWFLVCLPIYLVGTEAAPACAVLLPPRVET